MYATGTSRRVDSHLLPELSVFITTLVLSVALPLANVSAAIDVASKVAVQVVARPGAASGAGAEFVVRDGSVLRTGDGVQLRLASETQAYVYVIAYGSSNTAILLHPFSTRPEDALIEPGRTNIIPGSDVFLPLDGREGRETLFTIVSETPLRDISQLLPRIEAHGEDLSAITAMIDATYPQVRRLTFKHIGARPLVGLTTAPPRTATTTESARAIPAPTPGDEGIQRIGGESLLPPADDGWSVPSTQGFGNAEPTTSGTAQAAAASTPATESLSGSDTAPGPVSPALRRAREAAGIDERQFQGILATLPDGGAANVPASLRARRREQGVLSAQGSRIPAVDAVERDGSGPMGANDPRNRSPN